MTDSQNNPSQRLETALETIDEAKRSSMRKLVVAAAFAAPLVTSFAINGMMVSPALAGSNMSNMS